MILARRFGRSRGSVIPNFDLADLDPHGRTTEVQTNHRIAVSWLYHWNSQVAQRRRLNWWSRVCRKSRLRKKSVWLCNPRRQGQPCRVWSSHRLDSAQKRIDQPDFHVFNLRMKLSRLDDDLPLGMKAIRKDFRMMPIRFQCPKFFECLILNGEKPSIEFLGRESSLTKTGSIGIARDDQVIFVPFGNNL